MTGLTTLFPRSSFVGFDHLFNELEYTAKHSNDHYPPHNIIKTSESDYLIELAVAGFSQDELTVEVKDRMFQKVETLVIVVFLRRSLKEPSGCLST
jgi:HSP20 family molecular chaperone IbpA